MSDAPQKIGDYYLHFNQHKIANALVTKHHYSHRPIQLPILSGTLHEAGGLTGNFGRPVAACIFSIPSARWSERTIIELTRLVRVDDVQVPLTALIARCCKQLKAQRYHLLVSFADSQQDHHGGIYQAASWSYHEQRKSINDGFIIDGYFHPKRSCHSRWGESSMTGLRKVLGPNATIEAHYDVGKHLYWRALTKEGLEMAKRLGLGSNPYPKPDGAPQSPYREKPCPLSPDPSQPSPKRSKLSLPPSSEQTSSRSSKPSRRRSQRARLSNSLPISTSTESKS
jgi:hypothetical protein